MIYSPERFIICLRSTEFFVTILPYCHVTILPHLILLLWRRINSQKNKFDYFFKISGDDIDEKDLAFDINEDGFMSTEELKLTAEKILSDFEKAIGDISLMAGYIYDKKKVERLERMYNEQIEQIIHGQLKEFQSAYIKRLNYLCDKALREMTTQIAPNDILTSKMKFWKGIYENKPVELIISRYLDAVESGNKEFIYFVENEIIKSQNFESYREQLSSLIKNKKKLRVQQQTQEEINELNKLYGFYIQSLDFGKSRGLNLERIQKLFSSLNKHFHAPLKEILAS